MKKLTVKEAVSIVNALRWVDLRPIAPPRFEEAMDKLERENRCTNCGKKMRNIKDPLTGVVNPYLWGCTCMKKGMTLSRG